MATAVFQGASSDWDDTSNWSGGAGAGGVPANNDTVVIASSSQDLDTNLTTGLTGITLKIGSGYTGTIGGSANFLDLDGGTASLSSGGDVYITGTWTTVEVLGGRASSTAVTFAGNASTAVTTLRCLGGLGTVTTQASGTVTTLEMYNCPQLTVSAAHGSGTTVTQDSGTLTLSGSISGTVTLIGGTTTISGSATVATLDLQEGGRLIHTSSGTITTANLYGIFDGSQNMNSSVTITNSTTYESAKVNLRNGLKNYTLSNAVTYNGGEILWPAGSSLTVT